MRMSPKHVEARVSIVNGMLGFDTDSLAYNTIGSIQLYGSAISASYQIHRVVSDGGGVSALSALGTLRETAEFVSGMIAALRIAREDVTA